jgi:hypothetical protein
LQSEVVRYENYLAQQNESSIQNPPAVVLALRDCMNLKKAPPLMRPSFYPREGKAGTNSPDMPRNSFGIFVIRAATWVGGRNCRNCSWSEPRLP